MPFKLGNEAASEAKKSLRALKSHIKQGPESSSNPDAIYVTINTTVPLLKQKDYTPRIIPVTHKLDKLENKSVLLVTKDPSTPYRNLLTDKKSPTEDVFNQIFTVTKLKKITSNHKKVVSLFKEFDIVVADHRVHKLLPDILGATFYQKNKKIPFVVQMAPTDPNAKLVKTSKSHKLKDERCEPKFVKGQMNSIARNPYCIVPANGTSITIKIGFATWPTEKLVDNINDVLVYFMDKKYPSGGLIKTKNTLESVFVKGSDTISLPVYKTKQLEQEQESELSDF